MKSDGFTNIRQGFFAVFALAYTAGKTRHLRDYVAVVAGI
jgi:hypothetical protein